MNLDETVANDRRANSKSSTNQTFTYPERTQHRVTASTGHETKGLVTVVNVA